MAPHSSTLAWKIPWMEEPGRLQSMGSWRVWHEWETSLSLSLSCIGEGNGNPLQCSCLENPRDRGASWAAVYGVAQSRTRLKWLSSSSSSSDYLEELLSSFTPCRNVKKKKNNFGNQTVLENISVFPRVVKHRVTASQFHSKAITKDMIICPHKNSYMKVWCLILLVAELCMTPWIEAHQAPLCMEFLRQEYWSG